MIMFVLRDLLTNYVGPVCIHVNLEYLQTDILGVT